MHSFKHVNQEVVKRTKRRNIIQAMDEHRPTYTAIESQHVINHHGNGNILISISAKKHHRALCQIRDIIMFVKFQPAISNRNQGRETSQNMISGIIQHTLVGRRVKISIFDCVQIIFVSNTYDS